MDTLIGQDELNIKVSVFRILGYPVSNNPEYLDFLVAIGLR